MLVAAPPSTDQSQLRPAAPSRQIISAVSQLAWGVNVIVPAAADPKLLPPAASTEPKAHAAVEVTRPSPVLKFAIVCPRPQLPPSPQTLLAPALIAAAFSKVASCIGHELTACDV